MAQVRYRTQRRVGEVTHSSACHWTFRSCPEFSSILQATVLLSANVGFLAIQSIDNTPGSSTRSVAQIACYASSLFSLVDYVVVQVLMRRHRYHASHSAEKAVSLRTRPLSYPPLTRHFQLQIISESEDSFGGLELLAVTVR